MLALYIGKLASLWQPVHTSLNFNIDIALVDQGVGIIVINDLVRQDSHGDVHVCIVFCWHGGAQVEIFKITHHALGIGGGHNTVEQELGCGQVGCFGADISIIMDSVTTNHPADMVWYHFLIISESNVRRHCKNLPYSSLRLVP